MLTVYKASAGSGKTYRLAVEYIKLLAKDPMAFDSILAVTFTNKAAGEMKQRILSQLYGLSHSLPKSDNYLQTITSELNISPDLLRKRAGMALSNILHNFSRFHVGTIDSFFQQVLRNLAREFNLAANMRVELSDKGELERQAVDDMVSNLRGGEDTMKWIIDRMETSLEENKGWNVLPSLEKFSEHLSDDEYKYNREVLQALFADSSFFDNYSGTLYNIVHTVENTLATKADVMQREAESLNINIGDFSYGSDIANYLKAISSKKLAAVSVGTRLQDKLTSTEKWVKSSDKGTLKQTLTDAAAVLQPMLADMEAYRLSTRSNYLSARATLQNLSSLRLLCAIDSHLHSMNSSEGRFLLADTGHFLNSFIDNCDAPFIYEKIGSKIRHIMIDEFQDTSTVQWNNFRVLINDCISNGANSALVVGDVKQSIYRWRSGDWKLLNNIETFFPTGLCHVVSMDINYRSCSNIIRFNRAFFKALNTIESQAEPDPKRREQYERAYSDVWQKVPKGKADEGEVLIDIIQQEPEAMEKRVVETLCYLVYERKVKPGSIAILVRNNEDISSLALYCKDKLKDLKFISAEAFRLEQSQAVCLIMAALRHLAHPDDMMSRAVVAKIWGSDTLPEAFTHSLAALPLLQQVESICRMFHLYDIEGENLYIASFMDRLMEYISNRTADTEGFLQLWYGDGSLKKKAIPASESEGIQLVTIHKSKGLEFDHVIIPFCDWELRRSNSNLWVKPSAEPYNAIPILPVNTKKELADTVYANDYHEENFQLSIDNANILYVAFTRAVCNLYVFATNAANNDNHRHFTMAAALSRMQQEDKQEDKLGLLHQNADGTLTYRFGTFAYGKDKDNYDPLNPFMQKEEPLPLSSLAPSPQVASPGTSCGTPKIKFLQSNKSRDLFGLPYHDAVVGTALHSVLEKVEVAADLHRALLEAEQEGVFNEINLSRTEIASLLNTQMESNPIVASWFAPGWTLHNECAIINPEGETLRPDRVMSRGNETVIIDYKFGEENDSKYSRQLSSYAQLLTRMGYKDIKAYLWYVTLGKVTAINV